MVYLPQISLKPVEAIAGKASGANYRSHITPHHQFLTEINLRPSYIRCIQSVLLLYIIDIFSMGHTTFAKHHA